MPPDPYDDDERRWAAVVDRDRAADGAFVFAVTTTGVYCRPSCPARRPNRENVRFHDTAADAEAAGFRACLRCRPAGPTRAEVDVAAITEACRAIASARVVPAVAELAAAAGLGTSRFHRRFKAITGVTPKQYAAAHRAERVRAHLSSAATITDALHASGYGSSGRFYEEADAVLGMTPSAWRAGGAGVEIRFATGEGTLGVVLVAHTERGVCAILLGDDRDPLVADLRRRFPRAELVDDATFEALVARVVAFVDDPRTGLDLPLDVRGTAFQQRVWQALRRIPPGATATYTDVALAIGAPSAVRAVAGACAANAVAVAIPCHRVVRGDGTLSGYRWGVQRKRALLDRERDPS